MHNEANMRESGGNGSDNGRTWRARRDRRTTALILGGILLVGLVLRGLYLQELREDPCLAYPWQDAGYHDHWARGLATGRWTTTETVFSDPEIRRHPYFRPPGYPFFLAGIYVVFGTSHLAAIAAQMGVGLLNCVLAYFLGRKVFGRAEGLIFAFLMSAYWIFIYFEGELLAPVVLVTLALSVMLALRFWFDRTSFLRAFLGGLVLGLFAVCLPNVLLCVPVVLGWALWASRRHGGAGVWRTWLGMGTGLLAAVAPVTIRNYIVGGDFVLICSNMGVNLYIGNNATADGVCPHSHAERPEELSWTSADYPQIAKAIEASQGRQMSHSEVSRHFAGKAIRYMRANPLETIRRIVARAALFWGPMEVANNEEIECVKAHSRILGPMPGFAMALSLFGVGLIHLFSRVRQAGGQVAITHPTDGKTFAMVVLILLFVGAYFVSYLPFFAADRYRVPITPYLLLFGAFGLARMGELAVAHKIYGALFWALVYGSLYVAASQPMVAYSPSPANWHFQRGISYSQAKRLDLAAMEYRKAIAIEPHFTRARYNLGNVLSLQQEHAEAAKHYRLALEEQPNFAEAHVNLGVLLVSEGKLEEAALHFRKALELQPDMPQAHVNLGDVLELQDRREEAISHYRHALQASPNLEEARIRLERALRNSRQGRETRRDEQ